MPNSVHFAIMVDPRIGAPLSLCRTRTLPNMSRLVPLSSTALLEGLLKPAL